MGKKSVTSKQIMLRNVRLSFPQIWTPKAFQEGQPPSFQASFLLDPTNKVHAASIVEIKAETADICAKYWGQVPSGVKKCFGLADTIDPETGEPKKPYEGYKGMFYLAGANKRRFQIVDRDGKTPLTEQDGKPYAGCFVNALISLWNSDHPKGGKRVSCNILTMQFAKEGTAFGAAPVEASEVFEALEDEDGGEATAISSGGPLDD